MHQYLNLQIRKKTFHDEASLFDNRLKANALKSSFSIISLLYFVVDSFYCNLLNEIKIKL